MKTKNEIKSTTKKLRGYWTQINLELKSLVEFFPNEPYKEDELGDHFFVLKNLKLNCNKLSKLLKKITPETAKEIRRLYRLKEQLFGNDYYAINLEKKHSNDLIRASQKYDKEGTPWHDTRRIFPLKKEDYRLAKRHGVKKLYYMRIVPETEKLKEWPRSS